MALDIKHELGVAVLVQLREAEHLQAFFLTETECLINSVEIMEKSAASRVSVSFKNKNSAE